MPTVDSYYVLAIPHLRGSGTAYLTPKLGWGYLHEALRFASAADAKGVLRGAPELDPDNRSLAVCVTVDVDAAGIRTTRPKLAAAVEGRS